jgi:NAD(P)-dependent dehydrogenase (short-subunit alcohol dehydrogenase family)
VNDIFSLAGKTALVAGASRGIGLAIAQGLADAGAHTVLAARSMDKLEEQAASLTAKGHKASAVRMDMADSKSIADAVEPRRHRYPDQRSRYQHPQAISGLHQAGVRIHPTD